MFIVCTLLVALWTFIILILQELYEFIHQVRKSCLFQKLFYRKYIAMLCKQQQCMRIYWLFFKCFYFQILILDPHNQQQRRKYQCSHDPWKQESCEWLLRVCCDKRSWKWWWFLSGFDSRKRYFLVYLPILTSIISKFYNVKYSIYNVKLISESKLRDFSAHSSNWIIFWIVWCLSILKLKWSNAYSLNKNRPLSSHIWHGMQVLSTCSRNHTWLYIIWICSYNDCNPIFVIPCKLNLLLL